MGLGQCRDTGTKTVGRRESGEKCDKTGSRRVSSADWPELLDVMGSYFFGEDAKGWAPSLVYFFISASCERIRLDGVYAGVAFVT